MTAVRVGNVMRGEVLIVDRNDPFVDTARRMVDCQVTGAVVAPEAENGSPGIVTERDAIDLVAAGDDPRTSRVADRSTPEATCATPDWPLHRAADAMISGGFRHLPVLDAQRVTGIVSIRDVVRRWVKERAARAPSIQIAEAMNRDIPALSPGASLREVSRVMVERRMGAAVVEPAKAGSPPRMLTEQDVLEAIAAGQDPDAERAGDHLSRRMTFSAPDWSLKQAAEAMLEGGFQHVVVVDPWATVGVISMRDILGRWLD